MQDLVIVGGGVMGLAAARAAATQGKRVTLVDPRLLVNEHNASNDESKVFRLAYGSQKAYVKLAKHALAGWRKLEDEWGSTLFHQTGVLLFGPPGGFADQSARTLLEMGEDVRFQKGPIPGFAGVDEAVLDAKGGWLDARACLAALEARAIAAGATIRRGVAAKEVRRGRIVLDTGEKLEARGVLVAAGFEAPRLVPALRGRIRVTRQPEVFFDAPLDMPVTPVFAAFEEGFYGFPMRERTVKVADHRKGPSVTRFEARPPLTPDEALTARAWLRRRMPALAERPVARHRICLYDNTADDEFILGRADGVVIAAGFSGHGFKFAPAIGDEMARIAT